ncbi:MAG TPA: class I SAM-dependent methyltransferase [Frankiaceae bacterium]|jgi:SAM-dependent methyltransferase|nr:class I SAM-dependent methyltransferase [Frankiaceae bacterium]
MTAPTPTPTSGWTTEAQAAWYLERIGTDHPRRPGEVVLVETLPPEPHRVLDLGGGDGRLTAMVLESRPSVAEAVLIDRSPPMLRRAAERFTDEPRVDVRHWDLHDAIDPLGEFDLIVSGFAIHHLEDARKRELFTEIARQVRPGGLFANLEVVASASPRRHAEFLAAIGRTADDPEDRLASVEDQVAWMRDAGLRNVDCLWRWRGFALLVGEALKQ